MSKQEINKTNSQIDSKSDLNELEQELTTINPQIFHGVNPKKKEEILKSFSVTMVHLRSHSGPLPDAETLIQYNSVIPDGADRIMKMAEKQQEHRMELEMKVVTGHSRQSVIGQWFGLIIGLVGIGCGTFLAYSGEPTVGGIIAGGTVVSLVSVFVIGKKLQKSED